VVFRLAALKPIETLSDSRGLFLTRRGKENQADVEKAKGSEKDDVFTHGDLTILLIDRSLP